MADYTSSYSGAEIDAAIAKAAELPTIVAGDANKSVKVNSGETAYEFVDEYSDSEIDSLLSNKENTITGAATTITGSDLTASKILASDASGKVVASAVASAVLSYISGLTGNALDASSEGVVKGWISFNGTGTINIRDSYNVSSIVDNGVGNYTVNWDTDFANQYYSFGGGCYRNGGSTGAIMNFSGQAAGSIDVYVFAADGVTTVDASVVSVNAIGDQ